MNDDIKYYILIWSGILVNILYFVAFFGIASIDKTYIRKFSAIIQFVVGILLVLRFNSYTNTNNSLSKLDRHIIYLSGFFLLINVFTTEIYVYFVENTEIGYLGKVIENQLYPMFE